jgi:hypothetical protein
MDMYLTALSETQGTLKRLHAREESRRAKRDLSGYITQRCGTLWSAPPASIREFTTSFVNPSDALIN